MALAASRLQSDGALGRENTGSRAVPVATAVCHHSFWLPLTHWRKAQEKGNCGFQQVLVASNQWGSDACAVAHVITCKSHSGGRRVAHFPFLIFILKSNSSRQSPQKTFLLDAFTFGTQPTVWFTHFIDDPGSRPVFFPRQGHENTLTFCQQP